MLGGACGYTNLVNRTTEGYSKIVEWKTRINNLRRDALSEDLANLRSCQEKESEARWGSC